MKDSKVTGLKYLRYKDRFSGEWSKLEFSKMDKKILNKVSHSSQKNKNLRIFRPIHIPELSVLYAIECIYSNLRSNRDVGILTFNSSDFCGSKKDIKSEFERYCLTEPLGMNTRSLSNIFSISRVDNEGFKVEESSGDRDKSLVIVKDPSKIGKFGDLDALIVNYASKFPDEEVIENIRESSRSALIELFSPFSSWKKENRMKGYGLRQDEISGCFPKNPQYTSNQPNSDNFPIKYTLKQSRIMMKDKQIDFQQIDSEISELFGQLNEIRKNANLGLMKEYLNRREFLLREIPVSLNYYQKSLKNKDNVMISSNIRRTSEEFRSRVEGSTSGRIESSAYDIAEILDDIEEVLMKRNPKYEMVEREIKSGNLDRANFFLSKKKFRDAFEEKLNEELDEKHLKSIKISHPNSIRQIRKKDPMICFDDMPPWLSQFYLYPGSVKTGILKYSEPNVEIVQKQIEKHIKSFNNLHEENKPYKTPEITIDGTKVSISSSDGKSGEKDILRGYWREIVQDRSSTSNRNSQLAHYTLSTDSKGEKELGPRDMVLKKTSGALAQNYEIIKPSEISGGDSIIVIDNDDKTDIFEDRLNEFYESEIEEEELEEITESVNIWKDSISDIVKENDKQYDEIWKDIATIDRNRDTVIGWFKSAYYASSVLQMAENVELVIGPRKKDDLKKIGRTFQLDDVLANIDEIHAGMKTLRTINRSLGRNLKDNITSKETLQNLIDSGEEFRVEEANLNDSSS